MLALVVALSVAVLAQAVWVQLERWSAKMWRRAYRELLRETTQGPPRQPDPGGD